MKFKRKEQSQFKTYQSEYLALGQELKNTTRESLAEKFGVSQSGFSTITKLTEDDFSLIKQILQDRRESMERRKFLRRMLNP